MTVRYMRREARAQLPLTLPRYHEWTFPDGSRWAEFYRTPSGYVVRFPDAADFEITRDGRDVRAYPVPGSPDETTEHLYLNQVLPLAFSRLGRLVFHGSAVTIDDGVIAFLAPSGRGKSTLAAAFAVAGHRFLTDDGLVLERDGDGFVVVPSHPSLRLWSDSQAALQVAAHVPEAARFKTRLAAGRGLQFCPERRPLTRVYFLGDGTARDVTITRMDATEALVEWVKHSFLLDPAERPLLAAHFDQVAALARCAIAYHLDYPRQFVELPRLRTEILAQVQAGGDAD